MKRRSADLITSLESKGIDAVMITSAVNRRYYSGFTGSNGVVVLSRNGRVLFTDFRYTNALRMAARFARSLVLSEEAMLRLCSVSSVQSALLLKMKP